VDIINFLVMCDELCENSGFLDVPDGAGGINGRGADEVGHLGVPVEGGEGSRKVVILYQR
jgi:hypothetical protein